MEERICGKDEFWDWSGRDREAVMDCDSGDEGNNEVKCVKSDENDKYRVDQKSKQRTHDHNCVKS